MLYVFIPFRNEQLNQNMKYLFYNILFFSQQPEITKIVLCNDSSIDSSLSLVKNFLSDLDSDKKKKCF